ncbi:hypothetical protein BC939DRAFT_447542 [Gamsiella multidivaricata]|uniref:uncharacterized protein n=1 Tax=Gamsiella multidivaricata TaxID=101098 RepID=UPI002220052D|nr:uncharacterized protein BC939DRAFT_447542 [Gamsiella multidivaricata]KAG0369096.1 hypothetical protein BGZ54_000352 [Gamsiella multidivaricata]KAI7826016.1 hypothetical protein BC939DRAFT_447542 [Gamsiella multidivaricata]
MSKALDPLRRLVVQFNARLAHIRAFPTANTAPPPAPPHHLHAPSVPFSKPLPAFGQFQVKVPYPSHKDGPVLLAHLNREFNSFARNLFVPEPVRVAAVDYACRSAGRPQIASLLSKGSQRMIHHQPLRFAVPHGFAKNMGVFSTRGFSSGATAFQPALNGPVKMMAQMYAKPLGSLPANSQKLSEKDHHQQYRLRTKKRQDRNKNRSGEIKKRTTESRLSSSTIRAFLNRATLVEQQHQILSVSGAANVPITTATAISLAKVAGKSVEAIQELPKLNCSESCPTNVEMSFLLDASPLWHLDTMVSALHTDSLRAPKELNGGFIENLLEITNAQYQHFLEVSAILQKLVQCPEAREITLEGYELRVYFVGTTLFDMAQFLKQLGIDPKSPHFDLEEVYVDETMAREQYFPQASVNDYYAPSLSDNETWDECSSLQSSMMMYTDSERNSSVSSFATLEDLPEQESPWEGVVPVADTADEAEDIETEAEAEQEAQEVPQEQDIDAMMEMTASAVVAPALSADGLFPGEEVVSPWKGASTAITAASMIQESTEHLNELSSRILNSAVVSEEYFDNIRGFLDSIEAVHRHSEKLFGSPASPF